jgi:telomerase reverse transcriptase
MDDAQVMCYIFPQEFGLHNPFTSEVNPFETVQPFKDYTMREDEISNIYGSADTPKIPRRLRGRAVDLVRKLRIRHSRCAYAELLNHYCPIPVRILLRLMSLY